jgi:hypothetical protein
MDLCERLPGLWCVYHAPAIGVPRSGNFMTHDATLHSGTMYYDAYWITEQGARAAIAEYWKRIRHKGRLYQRRRKRRECALR